MSPSAYLLYSIQRKCYLREAWIISLFCVTQESDAQKSVTYPGKLIREPFGFFMIDSSGERVKIETEKKTTEPFFSKTDPITITPEWLDSVSDASLETTVGCLLINLICLYEPFGKKLSYQNQKGFRPGDIEAMIAPRLESNVPLNVRKPDVFYVDELLRFGTAVSFVESLSSVIAHSITRVGLYPAPGRKEFKKELLTKYTHDELRDPVRMAQFEKELENFDNTYLKDDPAFGKFMAGKKVKGSRMKLFMTQGGESNGFENAMDVVPVIPALEDGIPLDPEGFTAISNTIRYGSFSRGAETVNGGVTAKSLMRAADNWKITEGDCKTPFGIQRLYRGNETKELIGRYVLEGGKPVLIETEAQASAYDSKGIIVRSPQYCRRPGTETCEICAGKALSKFPTGVPIPLMELSGGILNDSLKKMHNASLSTVTASLPSIIT